MWCFSFRYYQFLRVCVYIYIYISSKKNTTLLLSISTQLTQTRFFCNFLKLHFNFQQKFRRKSCENFIGKKIAERLFCAKNRFWGVPVKISVGCPLDSVGKKISDERFPVWLFSVWISIKNCFFRWNWPKFQSQIPSMCFVVNFLFLVMR